MATMTAEEAAEWGKTLNFEKVWAAIMETDRRIAESAAETDRRIAESAAETDRRIAESAAETDRRIAEFDRRIAESAAETDRRMAETDRRIAETDRRIAETDRIMAETFKEIRLSSERTGRIVAEIAEESKKTDKMVKELSKNIGGINNSIGKWMEKMTAARLWKKFDQFGFVFTKDGSDIKFRDKNGRVISEVDILLEDGIYVMLVEVKFDLTTKDVDEHLERIEKVRRCMDEHDDRRKIVAAVAGSIAPDNVRLYAQRKGLYVIVPSGKTVAVADVPDSFTHREW
jgi:hypothetical protein